MKKVTFRPPVKRKDKGDLWYIRVVTVTTDDATGKVLGRKFSWKKGGRTKAFAKKLRDELELQSVTKREFTQRPLKDFALHIIETAWSSAHKENMQHDLNKILAVFGDQHVDEINILEIETYLKNLHCGGRTKNASLTVFRKLFFAAEKANSLPRGYANPILMVKRFEEGKKEPRALTPEEIQRLLHACKASYETKVRGYRNGSEVETTWKQTQTPPQWLYDVVFAGLTTGLRRGNLAKLQWQHINWKDQMLSIPSDLMKTKKALEVPINDDLFELLKTRYEENKKLSKPSIHVFALKENISGRKRNIEKWYLSRGSVIYRAFRKAVARAKLSKPKEINFHSLRKTFATTLLNAGVSVATVAGLGGWSNPSTVFAHYADKGHVGPQREALKKIEI